MTELLADSVERITSPCVDSSEMLGAEMLAVELIVCAEVTLNCPDAPVTVTLAPSDTVAAVEVRFTVLALIGAVVDSVPFALKISVDPLVAPVTDPFTLRVDPEPGTLTDSVEPAAIVDILKSTPAFESVMNTLPAEFAESVAAFVWTKFPDVPMSPEALLNASVSAFNVIAPVLTIELFTVIALGEVTVSTWLPPEMVSNVTAPAVSKLTAPEPVTESLKLETLLVGIVRVAVPALVRLTVKPDPVAVKEPAVWSIAVASDDPDVNVTAPPVRTPARAMVPVVAVKVLSLLPTNEPACVIKMLLLSEVSVAVEPVPVSIAATVRSAVPTDALVVSKDSVPDEEVF